MIVARCEVYNSAQSCRNHWFIRFSSDSAIYTVSVELYVVIFCIYLNKYIGAIP